MKKDNISTVSVKKVTRDDMLLYAVTDRSWLNGRSLVQAVTEALQGGITFLQIREKELGKEDFVQQAEEIKQKAAEFGIPFVVNDSVEIASEIDADGVHIGQGDMELIEARKVLGPDKIIGVSAQTVDQAKAAEKNGADYLGVGAVFSTSTKLDARPLEKNVIRDICEAVKIPVVGIGGIQADNMKELRGSGLDGAAVVSAIFATEDIRKATELLRKTAEEVFND